LGFDLFHPIISFSQTSELMITENLPDDQLIHLEKQALNKELEYLLQYEVPHQWNQILQYLKVCPPLHSHSP
jgi:hypothetical protein